ncbi:MAG: DUF4159 domain-containing protein [Chthoniobacterales bacterium]
MDEKSEQPAGQSESKSSLLDRLIDKFSESRFFTISFVLHVLLILIFGGTVLFEAMQEPPDFEGGEGGFLQAGEEVATPPSAQTQPKETTFTVTTPTVQNTTVAAITTTGQNPLNFQMAAIITPSTMPKPATPTAAPPTASAAGAVGMTAGDAKQIGDFTKGWGGKGSGSGTGTRAREFAFTAFIAKYNGGNWDSTVDLKDGKICRGSLPNLLEFMSKESRDKIKTDYRQVEAIPLDSDKMFSVKPPFIFFTGSRDFVLSDTEVKNLQKYIRLGGAIWGDSSVPGEGSRFDIAFRKQMQRVMPDKDKAFEKLDPNDPMFKREPYFPEIKIQPAGLNYYDDPVYVMRYLGEIAIIYTSNDYGGMWRFGIKNDGRNWVINTDRDEEDYKNGQPFVAQSQSLYPQVGIYLHNVDPNPPISALLDTYKFGVNMVIHLLTRWEDKLRSAPRL